MRTKHRNCQCGVSRASMLITLTIITLFGCSRQSLAQQWNTNGNNISNANSGNVGIGTTSPIYSLDVNGGVNGFRTKTSSVSVNDVIAMFENPNGVKAIIRGNGNVGIGTQSPIYSLDVNGGVNGFRTKTSSVSVNDAIAAFENANGIQAIIRGNGNVGIGTSSPLALLDVRNSDGLFYAGFGYGTNKETFIRAGSSTTGVLHFGDLNTTKTLLQENGGNVGIGTTAPTHKLDVAGAIRSSSGGFVFPDGTVQTTAGGGGSQWTTLGTSIVYNGGNVGINSSTPPAKLHVVGVGPQGTAVFTGTNWASHFNYNGDNSEDTYIRGGKSTSRVIVNDANSGSVVLAYGGGFVGIGTWSPTEKLEVVGNIKVSGNINAKYQDVAEWVESSQEIVAGTVVILDSSRSNNVIASTRSYDSRVAGVISRQPGLTLGEAGEGRVLVATTGRVKVKVDATNGPIEIGDLLVTSDREGFAMKSLPVAVGGVRIHRPGTLIGKALEPLAKGTGEILVLLSLQ